jgi:hypothetical protein
MLHVGFTQTTGIILSEATRIPQAVSTEELICGLSKMSISALNRSVTGKPPHPGDFFL